MKKIIFVISVIAIILLSIIIFRPKLDSVDKVNLHSLDTSTKQLPTLGSKKTENLIVEFGDYNCIHCRDFNNHIFKKINEKYIKTGKAKYRFVNLAFLGKNSVISSKAAHSVNLISPKNFWEFHDFLYQLESQDLTISTIDSGINKLNISKYKKQQIIEDYRNENSYKKDQSIAKKYEINSTPQIFINGTHIKNPYKIEEYKKYIK